MCVCVCVCMCVCVCVSYILLFFDVYLLNRLFLSSFQHFYSFIYIICFSNLYLSCVSFSEVCSFKELSELQANHFRYICLYFFTSSPP